MPFVDSLTLAPTAIPSHATTLAVAHLPAAVPATNPFKTTGAPFIVTEAT